MRGAKCSVFFGVGCAASLWRVDRGNGVAIIPDIRMILSGPSSAPVAEQVDAADSKSAPGNRVGVRVPPGAPIYSKGDDVSVY